MNALKPFRFCALLLVLEFVFALIWDLRPHPLSSEGFLIGDCPYYAATAESLVHDGDWDLRNQLRGDLQDHHGFFALSKDGRIVPKHSTLMPILSCPFYLLAGQKGFLLFNIAQLFALLIGIMKLAGDGLGAKLVTLLAYLTTPFLAYTYNFSPDVLGAALLVWSFVCAIRGRAIACGLLAGLAIWAKIYLVFLVLPLAIILIPQGWKRTLTCGLAGSVAILPMLIINWHLFGSPFTTGYDRDARLTPDGFVLIGHRSRFNEPILEGLGNLLFDQRIGLFPTAILWFIWPVGVIIGWRANRQARPAIVALVLTLLLNLRFFARYDEWDASEFGNRFLFPAIAIGFALQGPLWERAIERLRSNDSNKPTNA